MAEAERALSTSLSAVSRPATSASQANPAAIDRAALMRRAHAIARQVARTWATTARRSPAG